MGLRPKRSGASRSSLQQQMPTTRSQSKRQLQAAGNDSSVLVTHSYRKPTAVLVAQSTSYPLSDMRASSSYDSDCLNAPQCTSRKATKRTTQRLRFKKVRTRALAAKGTDGTSNTIVGSFQIAALDLPRQRRHLARNPQVCPSRRRHMQHQTGELSSRVAFGFE